MMNLIDVAKALQSKIETTFRNAYSALEQANIDIGIETVQKIGYAVKVEKTLKSNSEALWVLKFLLFC